MDKPNWVRWRDGLVVTAGAAAVLVGLFSGGWMWLIPAGFLFAAVLVSWKRPAV